MSALIGDVLPAGALVCTVLDADGRSTTLDQHVITGRPTLLVFVRQFVCAGCSERTAELLTHHEALRAAGVATVIVGCGTPAHARAFDERLALSTRELTLLTDPTRAVHRAMGLQRSAWGALGPRATLNLLRAMSRGHENHWGHGDFYQLGGTFLLDAERRVVARHVEAHLGASLPLGGVVARALVMFARRNPEIPLP